MEKNLNTMHEVTCYKCGRSEVISMPVGIDEAVCPECAGLNQ